jgi:hypothetical protein
VPPSAHDEIRLREGLDQGPPETQEEEMGLHEYEVDARIAELHEIAALDRLAGEGQPSSVLNRWASREHREPGRHGLRRLLHLGH